jgi:oligoendopeptidase F
MAELKWNLDDILKEDEFDTVLKSVYSDLPKFDAIFSSMSKDMSEESFKEYLNFSNDVSTRVYRLYYFASLRESANLKDDKAKMLKQKVDELIIKQQESEISISHWLIGRKVGEKEQLDDKNAARLFASVPEQEYILALARKKEKHALSIPEENLDSKKDSTGVNIHTDVRDLIVNDFRYRFKPKGAKRAKVFKSEESIARYWMSANASEREASFLSVLEKNRENMDKLFLIYSAVVRNWTHMRELRKYDSNIAWRNSGNDVPNEAINTLLEVTRDNKDIYQRYFKWKAKQLGMEKLRRYDIYAPLEEESTISSTDRAFEIIDAAFKEFSPNFYNMVRQIIDSKHIDLQPRENKVPGAFCASIVSGVVPYVLTNYTGKTEDIIILAHELGHGVQFLYTNNLPLACRHPTVPLCETGSTFGAMVALEKILSEADPKLRKSLISFRMSESFCNILRQNYFVLFEIEAHQKINDGITGEELSNLYLSNLKEQFGDSVDVDERFKYEWLRISHLVEMPFYCYGYNFGELVSMALYSRYKEEGNSFLPKIEKLLSYGNTKSSDFILKEVGFDICSRDFWQQGFNMVRAWQDELEKL